MVSMQMNRRIAERMTPFDHTPKQVGMRQCETRYPTQGFYCHDRGIIKEAYAIPQDVASGSLHK
jgi:hypothetical protein